MPSCWRNSPSKLGWIRVRGTSSSWTCAELGGALCLVLDRSDREDVRLHQPRCANASAFGLRGYVDNTLPSRCYASPWSCVCVGIFLKLLRSPTVASEPGLCVDVICTSRTQVSCGRYKSYCLPACHTLVRRYCEMKRPGPTLRVRLRETGFTVTSTSA